MSLTPLWTNQLSLVQNQGKSSIKGQPSKPLCNDRAYILPRGGGINRGKVGARLKYMLPVRVSMGATQMAGPRRNGGLHIKEQIHLVDSFKAAHHQPTGPMVNQGLSLRLPVDCFHLGFKTGSGVSCQPHNLLINNPRGSTRSTLKTIWKGF